jgi:HAMP domain-containing protein
MIAHFLRDDAGQGLVEYCLVIALVAIVAHSALVVMGRLKPPVRKLSLRTTHEETLVRVVRRVTGR